MSDRAPAEIWIGGTIPISLVQPLCQAIAAEGVALDWGDATFRPKLSVDLQDACTPRDGVDILWLCDDQASRGQFEDLEAFLQKHRIAFRRYSDATSEYDPELVEYRPGLGIVGMPSNVAGEPVIPAERLRGIEEGLVKSLDLLKRGDRRGLTPLRSAYKLLRKQLPPRIPPLEAFAIEGGT